MSRELLDYRPVVSAHEGVRIVRLWALICITIIGAANVAMFIKLGDERAFGALLMLGDAGLLVGGLVAAPILKWLSGGASLTMYLLACVGGPVVAFGIRLGIIEASGMVGC